MPQIRTAVTEQNQLSEVIFRFLLLTFLDGSTIVRRGGG